MVSQLVELEMLRAEINRLIENPTTRPLDRMELAERLDRVNAHHGREGMIRLIRRINRRWWVAYLMRRSWFSHDFGPLKDGYPFSRAGCTWDDDDGWLPTRWGHG